MIQSDEATRPKIIPRASTRNAMARLGTISHRVYSMVEPAITVGSIEAMSPNFTIPATKLAPSRRLARPPSRIMGMTARRETRLARTGVMLMMAGGVISLLSQSG